MKKLFLPIAENIRIALESISSQLLRTILTVMIIAIGITALVSILSVITALGNTLENDFVSMGANTFQITRFDYSREAQSNGEKMIYPRVTYKEAIEFSDEMNNPFAITSISFNVANGVEVKYKNNKTDPEVNVVGIDQNFLGNSGLELEKGRNFNLYDIKNNIYNCIIGADFTKKLLKGINPIGKIISVRGVKFNIIGILKSKGSTFGSSKDFRLFIPINLARSIFSTPDTNYNISVQVKDKNIFDSVQTDAMLLMRMIRKLTPLQYNNFGIRRSDDLLNRISEITGTIGITGFLIAMITILGSSIALLNIMLVSVTERTKEIGIRKALGAKRSTITLQFFVETLVIAQLGALVGIILGIGLGSIISSVINLQFTIPWLAIFIAILIALIVAVTSGLYPAIKASRLDPVEALRYE